MPMTAAPTIENSHSERHAAVEAWRHLAGILPIVDLASDDWQPDHDWIESARDPFLDIATALFRTQRCHPLVVGLPGTGKSHLIREFARRLRKEHYPSLDFKSIFWIDCRHIGPEDSRACLEMLFRAVAGELHVLLCLDGLASLIRRAGGGSNRSLLCSLLNRAGLRVIGTMTPWEHADIIATDSELVRYFARVELPEVAEDDATRIAIARARNFSRAYDVPIADDTVVHTVRLTSHFLLNEQHPAKDLSILREAVEGIVFRQEQDRGTSHELGLNDTAKAIADRTGIPVATLLGDEPQVDFEGVLAAAVVGQPGAVATAARELRLIKAGLSPSDKPATVLLFAGLTGVGKTELAKRIAEVYSNSRRLQVYSMGNFTEPHSVSGIVGVPPGYVGYESGGRLINDLNADPYSVFLLDEAEKCHPNIWKPFLNLFDEGWIADQRGVKARADRAIFILTTNAGDRHIAQLADAGKSEDEIAEAVRQTLSRIRLERSTQPVFPPQFLARIRRIMVFCPLSEEAMIGIARHACRRLIDQWRRKRDVVVEISEGVITAIGRLGHRRNEESRQQEGGRIIQKLLDEILQDRLQRLMIAEPRHDLSHECITIDCDTSPGDSDDTAHALSERLRIAWDPRS